MADSSSVFVYSIELAKMDNRIIKYYAGELSEAERMALLQEASTDLELKREMMECQQVESLMQLGSWQKNELLGRQSLRGFMKARQTEQGRRLLTGMMRYAAVAVVCVFFTWWGTHSLLMNQMPSAVAQELTVPAGQRAHILLPDGTKVWVNANSTLTYPSVFGEERRVRLTGEAYFEVAKEKAPFIVSTGRVDVKALGTEFNVFNYPAEPLAVSLYEGSVRIYRPNQESKGVVLKPDQQLVEKDHHLVVQALTDDAVMWKEGLYAFDKQKMRNILKKLELYYEVKITVKDPLILEYEYTGKFRQWDGVMEVLRIIQKIHPFKIEKKENSNEIILYR